MSLDNGQEMLDHVHQCEATGIYDERFEEINSAFSDNFNNRHPNDSLNNPDMTNGGLSQVVVQGVDVYEYM